MSTKIKATGSRAEVFHSRARHTSGGLKKSDLMQTKNGRIVSRKAHAAGKKAIKRLRALGYVAKKGTFRLFRKGDAMSRKSRKRRSTRRRGGFFEGTPQASTSSSSGSGGIGSMLQRAADAMGSTTGGTGSVTTTAANNKY